MSLPGFTHAGELYRRDRRRAGTVLAAGIAARAFLMLLPLAFILAAVVGFLDQTYPNFSTRSARALGLTATLVRTIAQDSGDAQRGRWVLLLLGAALLGYATHSLYRALRMTHAVAWDLTPQRVPPGSVLLVCALLVLIPITGGLSSMVLSALPGILVPAAGLAGLVFYTALWLWISWLLPHRVDGWFALLPGAFAWGIGLTVLQFISVYLLPGRFSNSSQLYGALGVASATMAWLFIFGRLTVSAATLNAVLWDRRQGQ